MNSFEHLRWSVDDGIATVTMDRPPVNAVNQRMYGELRSAFGSGSPLVDAAKVIVLNGAGPHFCAGNDLKEFGSLSPDNADQRMAEVRAAFFAIQDCPIPVVAAVHGASLGTGLAIAASCDFVIASADARFGTPEVGVGVMGAARHLARLLPEPWVRWMYLTAESLGAEEMYALGAVREVVPATELEEVALRHARLIRRHSKVVVQTAKRALNQIEMMDLQPGYTFEQSLTTELSGHPDSIEARAATLERRAPCYPSEAGY